MPLRAPSTVPVVLRLELVILNAQRQCYLICGWIVSTEHRANAMAIMIGSVLNRFNVKGRAPRLGSGFRLRVLKVGRFLSKMIVLERLLCAWVEESTAA